MATIRRTFSFDSETDRDLLDWLAGLKAGQGSEAVRAALRAGIGGENRREERGDLAEVLRAVSRIEQLLAEGVVVTGSGARSGDVPPDVLENLDKLGM